MIDSECIIMVGSKPGYYKDYVSRETMSQRNA